MERTFGDLTSAEIRSICEDNICPLCGSEGFYHGPQGGAAVNILCDCGAVFNVPNVWEDVPLIPFGQYLRDDEPRSESALAARKTFVATPPAKRGVFSSILGTVSQWLK